MVSGTFPDTGNANILPVSDVGVLVEKIVLYVCVAEMIQNFQKQTINVADS